MDILKTIKTFTVSILFIITATQMVTAKNYKILAFGDSLIAGYGLFPQQNFTSQLERQLRRSGHAVTVINAGVSGDTSSGAVARLAWVLAEPKNAHPDLIIVEIGANDALRGILPELTRANIDIILSLLESNKIKTLVAGMMAPPNMGMVYGTKFNRIYPELSAQYHHTLYPFFLEGVAGNFSLNQSDGIHPNARGVAIIVTKITPYILKAMPMPPY